MRVAVVGAVALALAGCSTATTPAAAPSHRPSHTAKPSDSPAKQTTAALAHTLAHNSTGAFGFTPGEARCVAKGFVNQFGVAGVQSMGLVTKGFKPGQPSGSLHMSGVDASAAADATLACVNGPGFVQNLLAKSSGSSAAACIAQHLGTNGTHEAMAAAFAGDRRVLEQALMPALAQCGSTSSAAQAPAAQAPAAQAPHLVPFEANGISIDLPGEPHKHVQTATGPAGKIKTTMYLVTVAGGNEVYGVGVAHYPGKIPFSLDHALHAAARKLHGTVYAIEPISLDGHQGRSATISTGTSAHPVTSFLRMVQVGRALYSCMYLVIGKSEAAPSATFQQVWSSAHFG